MADREVVKAIEKMNRDVCKMLVAVDKVLGRIANSLEQKQFDEWYPPEKGTAVQNMKGCVMLNAVDFDELVRASDEDIES